MSRPTHRSCLPLLSSTPVPSVELRAAICIATNMHFITEIAFLRPSVPLEHFTLNSCQKRKKSQPLGMTRGKSQSLLPPVSGTGYLSLHTMNIYTLRERDWLNLSFGIQGPRLAWLRRKQRRVRRERDSSRTWHLCAAHTGFGCLSPLL